MYNCDKPTVGEGWFVMSWKTEEVSVSSLHFARQTVGEWRFVAPREADGR